MRLFDNPAFLVIALVAIGAWVFTTWLRVKNGYPLEGSWGNALHPRNVLRADVVLAGRQMFVQVASQTRSRQGPPERESMP